MGKPCNNCGADIKWSEPYEKGDKPLNLDGTKHQCQKKESGGKYTSSKFPINKATEIYNLAEGILDSFYKKRSLTDDAKADKRLPVEQEAIFIESIFRTLTQGFKE